ncbi:hypothetical protein PhCBS80983_g01230 [Powellomyces hirtus]|uniref:WH1 domain-containing protein n=1 Tax=Powellomyces hirtus TaxID=109895 RepID=A0A507EDW5_9FUNG|nr:hypothetical protein PhCBS80983_g01230 [Powellomyces hirtus]
MDPAARLAVNLNVLRRHDPTIVSILDSSSHVVVYDFAPETKSWTKKGIEGTMFIFQRSAAPFYGLFVMNRLALENLMVLLNADMEVQLLQEFVIYRQPDDSVQGLWMYETADRTRIVKTLTTYTELCAASPPQQHQNQHQQRHQPTNQPVDLLAMLHRAKEAAPTPNGGAPVDNTQGGALRTQYPGSLPQRTFPNDDHSQQPQQQPQPQPRQQQQHQRSQQHPPASSAPPITPQQRQIQRLEDIWQWVEDMAPLRTKGGLPDTEFRRRMVHLAQV